MDRDEFLAQGQEFGLSGLELRQYVDDCVREARDEARDERAAARQAQIDVRQAEVEVRQADVEARELEVNLVAQQIRLEELRKENKTGPTPKPVS